MNEFGRGKGCVEIVGGGRRAQTRSCGVPMPRGTLVRPPASNESKVMCDLSPRRAARRVFICTKPSDACRPAKWQTILTKRLHTREALECKVSPKRVAHNEKVPFFLVLFGGGNWTIRGRCRNGTRGSVITAQVERAEPKFFLLPFSSTHFKMMSMSMTTARPVTVARRTAAKRSTVSVRCAPAPGTPEEVSTAAEETPAVADFSASSEEMKATPVMEASAPVESDWFGNPKKADSLSDVMAFGGSAPEVVNGRLAMLGFAAAVGAELSSGESVVQQVLDAPFFVHGLSAVFVLASFMPRFRGESLSPEGKSFGPFRASAEMLNGRLAMIGFTGLLASELITDKAFF